MPKPPSASTRNPAFQSELEPYREFIRECRAKRWSYPRKGLEGAIRSGWREANAASLAERFHAELEATLLQPLASQCRALEQAAPAVNKALEHMEDSTRQLRGYHFQSILVAMLISCLVIAGGCFTLGRWKASGHLFREILLLNLNP